ncbi:MAG TPA: DegT/DnrJ/EryC1/StrS family aminotransferase [Reyranella sp.]|nr:DegT/DnrJ/EryC1/StrS family aminotransferase [Reyranella sp.]
MFYAPQPRSRLYTTFSAYLRGLAALLDRGTPQDPRVSEFERKLGEVFSGQEVVAMPMARVGIYLLLKCLIQPGQKVILSPYTISDVVNMVLCAGGVPVFADVEANGSCNIDANEVAKLLRAETNVGAVLVTHMYGLTCDVDTVVALCKPLNVPVIEDAAQAFGARVGNRMAGTIGTAGVFSFGLLKNVTAFVGGAIITADRGLAQRVREELAQFNGSAPKMIAKKMLSGLMFDVATLPVVFHAAVYWLFRWAYLNDVKFFNNKLDTDSNPVAYKTLPKAYRHRMTGTQARLAQSQLGLVDKHIDERVGRAKLYDEGLRGLSGIQVPPFRADHSHIYLYYPVLAKQRDAVGQSMTRQLRDVQISHHRNCANLPCFSEFRRDCPNAERAANEVIYLPTYPTYTDDQVQANVRAIRRFLQEGI